MKQHSATYSGASGVTSTARSIDVGTTILTVPNSNVQIPASGALTTNAINDNVSTIGGRVRRVGGSEQETDALSLIWTVGIFGAIAYGVSKFLSR